MFAVRTAITEISMSDVAYDPSRHRKAGRGKVYDSIVDTIGDTPLVGLPQLSKEMKSKARVLAKLEFFNPLASVKDRTGTVGADRARHGADRADQRKHRDRPGLCGGLQGVSVDPDHAGKHVD